MTITDLLVTEHKALRLQVADIEAACKANSPTLETLYTVFRNDLRKHLQKEDEVYYKTLDDGKQIADRQLMHDLRNDHAGVLFALESLLIRLKKNNPLSEWQQKFANMTNVLLPHFDHEEKELFPLADKQLTPDQAKALLAKLQNLS